MNIVFFPRNLQHAEFFYRAATYLEFNKLADVQFIREAGKVKDAITFEFEKEIDLIWDDLKIDFDALLNVQKRYPEFDFGRAIYSEREYNFFPQYFGAKCVSREIQLKYLIGCFSVFEAWLNNVAVDVIVSELVIGMPDAVLKAVAESKGVKYRSFRQSKMTPGIVFCDKYYDEPFSFKESYDKFVEGIIPEDIKSLGEAHIQELRSKIMHPSYMELTKKPFKLITKYKLKTFLERVFKNRLPVYSCSRLQEPILKPIKWSLLKYFNVVKLKLFYKKYFFYKPLGDIKYFIYPLHYEPEASTSVRAFYFSDQLATIKLIAKMLPLGVQLIVKEHGGNQGYRKPAFYKEISYMPNVIMLASDFPVNSLLKNSLGVITLTGRMGWEAIVNKKPVVAFGKSFWSLYPSVINVDSLSALRSAIYDISNGFEVDCDEKVLLAFASAYIDCIFEGSFVLNSQGFYDQDNVVKFCKILKAI